METENATILQIQANIIQDDLGRRRLKTSAGRSLFQTKESKVLRGYFMIVLLVTALLLALYVAP